MSVVEVRGLGGVVAPQDGPRPGRAVLLAHCLVTSSVNLPSKRLQLPQDLRAVAHLLADTDLCKEHPAGSVGVVGVAAVHQEVGEDEDVPPACCDGGPGPQRPGRLV